MTLFYLGNKEFRLFFETMFNLYIGITIGDNKLTPNIVFFITIKYPKVCIYGSEIYNPPCWEEKDNPEDWF